LWIGDAAEIRTKRVRKQKTDRQDAQLILKLMLKDDFPRIWIPSWENRDLRQLLWHRHRMVQARTRIMNQLQAVALNEGLRCKKRLWREAGREQLEAFRLAPWASRRRCGCRPRQQACPACGRLMIHSLPQDAATSVWAAVLALADEVGGQYCENCHVGKIVPDDVTITAVSEGVRSYALDPKNAEAFWKKSEEMVGELLLKR
jgi:Transposase